MSQPRHAPGRWLSPHEEATPRAQARWLWVVLAATIAGIVVASAGSLLRRREVASRGLVLLDRRTAADTSSSGTLPLLGTIPAFSLLDQHGQSFDATRLAERIWVADFIFTRCAGQCLAMAAQMEMLQQRLGGAEDVVLVSFSVDPEYDAPEVLSRYAAERHAQADRWIFLTGDRAVIFRLSRDGFRLGVAETGGTEAEPILHSTRLVLVDGAGRIRGYYDGTDPSSVEQVLASIERLRRGG
jgi:protein SCO1/2